MRQGVWNPQALPFDLFSVWFFSPKKSHLNKILGIRKERSPRNCRIALTVSHDRWGASGQRARLPGLSANKSQGCDSGPLGSLTGSLPSDPFHPAKSFQNEE